MDIMTRQQAKTAGLKSYFTGKPCPQGHIALRAVSNGGCMDCKRIRTHQWYLDNSERIKKESKEYNALPHNQAHKKKYNKEYVETNREKINAQVSNKRATSINHKLKHCLRNRLYSALKGNFKTGSAVRDLGCSGDEFRHYVESLWQPGMSWDNYGNRAGKWSLDHYIPLSWFDLTDPNELQIASHYKNIRPIWHIDNLRKGDKLPLDENGNLIRG